MILLKRINILASLIFVFCFMNTDVRAEIVQYELTIKQQEINIPGKPAQGMTINGGIPGPTLRFKEGDIARIHVNNKMDVETSIHWHGILVPPDMDGVP